MRRSESQPIMEVAMEVETMEVEVVMEVVTMEVEMEAVLAGPITEVAEVPSADAEVVQVQGPAEINAAVFERAAEDRKQEILYPLDPFTAAKMEDQKVEVHLIEQCYYCSFHLYSGLQTDLDELEDEISVYQRMMGWGDQQQGFLNHIHWLQTECLEMLFSAVFIPASLQISSIANDDELSSADKISKMLYSLPRRVRKALPTPLKFNVMPYGWPEGTFEEFKEDIADFVIEEFLKYADYFG